jgi:hypothetical protein
MATIYYVRESSYGRTLRRIVRDNEASQAFQNLSGRATLTEADLRNLRALGVSVVDATAEVALATTERAR